VSPTAAIALSFSLELEPATVGAASILVVEGAADGALVRDLDAGAPEAAKRARLVPGGVAPDGEKGARFTPDRPLAPSALHTLVVTSAVRAGGIRMARPATRAFTTGPASSGAPVWRLVDPPAGASGVVRNLRAVEVAFSRPVDGVDAGALALFAEGEPAAASVEPCDENRLCFRILPDVPLAPERTYRVVAAPPIADDAGEPPFPIKAPPSFVTGPALRAAPPAIDGVVAIASSGCLVARFVTDAAAVGRACIDGDCAAEAARRTVHEIALPLAAGGSAAFTVSARDESTAPAAQAGPFDAPASSPRPLSVTEVLARPRGPWPAQQFVEILNRGAEPLALGGLVLRDEAGGDVLPAAALDPGRYALIVPADFAEDDLLDVAPAAGTLIVRIADGRLGGNGVREGGESVGLFEGDGRPISLFTTYGVTVAAGQSVRRAGACDVAGAFEATPGSATPGGP
jgi:hypothetical protein